MSERAAIIAAVRALFAEPPCEGAYRVGTMWFRGEGCDRVGLVGSGPTEEQIVEAIRNA